jgi:hypothetical protein
MSCHSWVYLFMLKFLNRPPSLGWVTGSITLGWGSFN